MLIRLFQQTTVPWGGSVGEWVRKVLRSSYPIIRRGLVSVSRPSSGSEGGHGLPAPIVTKDEFVEINLELTRAHAMTGSDQPLLHIANRAVGQRHDRLHSFT